MIDGLLAGRAAIISGVGPGLGRDVALVFAREGADMVLAARRSEVLEEVAAEVRALGRTAICVPADITVAEDCGRLVDAAISGLGGLHVLVNNAFAFGPREKVADRDIDEWRPVIEVNLLGTVRLSVAAGAVMAEAGGGSIVMVNTQAMRRNRPRRGAYAASKAALLSASQTLAAELGPRNIRVNSVVPGHVWGPPLEAFLANLAAQRGVPAEQVVGEVARELPLRRIPTGADVAEAVLFFASDRSVAITGQSLDVNGGNWFN
jgi:NAD(P)-dependent dehydrogenase (short-subunit alcohol dehydrogenase family)